MAKEVRHKDAGVELTAVEDNALAAIILLVVLITTYLFVMQRLLL